MNYDKETKERLAVIYKLKEFVEKTSLSGLLVTGSIAWGKGYAVNPESDIDLYIIAKENIDIVQSIDEQDILPKETISKIKYMLSQDADLYDTLSVKTSISQYSGSVYFFLESKINDLSIKIDSPKTSTFRNLRPLDKVQIKKYKSFTEDIVEYSTPIKKFFGSNDLWVRTDPIVLRNNQQFFGSIFISHLLFGDIYVDKNNVLTLCQNVARSKLKTFLSSDKHMAFSEFKKYLPRIERMNHETIDKLFDQIWESSSQNSGPTD